MAMTTSDPASLPYRLRDAVNAHDLEAMMACFASSYRNETPVHPSRGFSGNEQVRRNWTEIFAVVTDIEAEVLRIAVDGDTVWSEWEQRGHRPDGSPFAMRGVVIFGVTDGQAAWARFYLEPVEDAGGTADSFRRSELHLDRP
jgi:ketosteroid isomerase-like protein